MLDIEGNNPTFETFRNTYHIKAHFLHFALLVNAINSVLSATGTTNEKPIRMQMEMKSELRRKICRIMDFAKKQTKKQTKITQTNKTNKTKQNKTENYPKHRSYYNHIKKKKKK